MVSPPKVPQSGRIEPPCFMYLLNNLTLGAGAGSMKLNQTLHDLSSFVAPSLMLVLDDKQKQHHS